MPEYNKPQPIQIIDKDTGISTEVKLDAAGQGATVVRINFDRENVAITYIGNSDRVSQIVEVDNNGFIRTTNITYIGNSDRVSNITQTVV